MKPQQEEHYNRFCRLLNTIWRISKCSKNILHTSIKYNTCYFSVWLKLKKNGMIHNIVDIWMDHMHSVATFVLGGILYLPVL